MILPLRQLPLELPLGDAADWDPPTWIAGGWFLGLGCAADYRELARWHYRAGRPATWCRVSTIRHERPGVGWIIAAVGVSSWPTVRSRGRESAFSLQGLTYGDRARWANAHLRTVSRVIVRPEYRGAGLARAVIDDLVRRCTTPHIEATAAMGAFCPMFERCGFTRHDVPGALPYFCRATRT